MKPVVVKVGSSSLTTDSGVDTAFIDRIAEQVAALRLAGRPVVVVSSGAVAAGLPLLGLAARPTAQGRLQAAAAVGQPEVYRCWSEALARRGVAAAQVLLAPNDVMVRRRYLNARATLDALLGYGAVPVINENDTVAVDELRFGDNDRLAAILTAMIDAEQLVVLTDTDGLYTADPRRDPDARLLRVIDRVDDEIEAMAGGTGSTVGSGGMSSKLAAAKIASWAGVETVIADAGRPDVLADVLAGADVGTRFRAQESRLQARKLWLAFAVEPMGTVVVDDGARRALCADGRSLLAAGIIDVAGRPEADDVVDLAGEDGVVFARGITRWSADDIRARSGQRSSNLPERLTRYVVHRDDLVILP